jgi:phosphoglycerate dehydrogenase-like enzyme
VNVVVHGRISELGRRVIERELRPDRFSVRFVEGGAPDRDAALSAGDVLIIDHAPMTDADFAMMPRLRLVQRLGRGPFDISGEIAAAHARGIPFAHNRSGFAVRATAEHTVMVMLALPRRLAETVGYVRNGGWTSDNRYDAATDELAGSTIGLVGMGRIAREVARRLRPFEVTVRYWARRRLPAEQERELSVGYLPLPDLVAGADLVSLHVRANSAAEFRFGADLFDRMRPGAYFVNTSRGALVDQDALGRALQDGRLAGAALDVSDPEPPPADSPLRALPNLVLTPHVAGRTRQVAEAYYQRACANLVRLADGEALRDLVPPPSAKEDPC